MDAQIDALLLNNKPPSDEVEQELRKLRQENFEVLHDLNSKILDLENHLEELKTQRDATQRTTDRYQTILSPLRRLSPELLAQIFYQCLPTNRNPIIDAKESPILLTHICKFWRTAAIAEPRIWTRVYMTFEDLLSSHNWDSKRQHATNILRGRLSVFKTWISRCGIRPLSISLFFFSNSPWRTVGQIREKSHQVVLDFLEFLAQLSPRFEDLELHMPFHVYHVFEGMVEVLRMTNLATYKVELSHIGYDDEATTTDPLVLLEAPNLKNISISTIQCLPAFKNLSSMSTWRGVTDISIHSILTPAKLIFLLRHAPNLVRVKATIDSGPYAGRDGDLYSSNMHGTISLPFLRTFIIADEIGPIGTKNLGLYNRIDPPALTWVKYAGILSFPGSSETSDNSIVALLQRLPALKKLTLTDQHDSFKSNETRRIFRAVLSVTHLFLGFEKRSPAGHLVRIQPSRGSYFGRISINDRCRKLGLKHLVRVVPQNGSKVYPDSGLPLLPNLVSLEISSPGLDIRDQHLISLVTSRLKSSSVLPSSPTQDSSPQIAQLKHVGVVFYRPKTRDIAAKIQDYAERVGADMVDVFLDYPEPPASKWKHIGLAYGTRISDGRSWIYNDVEEFEDLWSM